MGDESERELQRLREMNEFKTRFMSMAAHELNTPLTPIRIQLHVLRTNHKGFADNPEAARGLDLLDRNVQRLARLVQDVLDATRLQSGHLPLRKQPISPSEIASEVVEGFQDAARQAGVEIVFNAAPEIRMDADPDRMAQLCSNLIGNAIKFTPSGGRINVALEAGKSIVTLVVADDGIGIRPEDLPRLGQPFTQAQEPISESRGTGLGLYICKGIAEEHGGHLAIDSQGLGRGTTVRIGLPLTSVVPAATGQPAVTPADSLERRVRRIL